jgi:hypothetical protein
MIAYAGDCNIADVTTPESKTGPTAPASTMASRRP